PNRSSGAGCYQGKRKYFGHPDGQFATASRVSAYIFCLRALAKYPQNLRIAAFNLGPKVIELAWTERFARSFPDDAIRALFMSQLPETRSHILLGRCQLERFAQKAVDVQLATRLCAENG